MLGYVYNVVLVIYKPLREYSPVSSAGGVALLSLIAVGILIMIAREFSRRVEKHLVMVFPKYAIYKDIVAGNVGGDAAAPSGTPDLTEISPFPLLVAVFHTKER